MLGLIQRLIGIVNDGLKSLVSLRKCQPNTGGKRYRRAIKFQRSILNENTDTFRRFERLFLGYLIQ